MAMLLGKRTILSNNLTPMLYPYPAQEIKRSQTQTADVVLLENHVSPRFAVEACRLDGILRLYLTDDKKLAEDLFTRATLDL
jgi:hypothetical protein